MKRFFDDMPVETASRSTIEEAWHDNQQIINFDENGNGDSLGKPRLSVVTIISVDAVSSTASLRAKVLCSTTMDINVKRPIGPKKVEGT